VELIEIGDQVRITGGPFAGRVGTITRIDAQSATIEVQVIERATPVVLNLDEFEVPPKLP
jgi:transcription antitermination factor NusG